MKYFAYIFSIYILVLTGMPCVDPPGGCGMHHDEMAQGSSGSHQDDADQCSPFCTCNCCVSPIVLQTTFVVYFDCSCLLQVYQEFYPVNYISSTYSSFWQPPKLA